MRHFLLALSLVLVLSRPAAAPTPGRTDPNTGLFPDSSIVDFRFLLDAPAGKRGFLRVGAGGHFEWADGSRARFWGVNVSSRSVFVDKAVIDKVVEVLARAGTNMVRLEAIDSAGGLLDRPGANNTRSLDASRLEIVDYWTARLRQHGIYYYLDLLDFRQFAAGDNVPAADSIGRAAKPYAMFDRRLIGLQKEYARELLTHRNPYTGLRYVDDPALALVEVCNEHGLFLKAGSLDALAEPYRSELNRLWNRWLAARYSSRDALKQAWGSVDGAGVLADNEDAAAGTVALPSLSAAPAPAAQPAAAGPGVQVRVMDVRRAPSRVADGVHFLFDLQRAYFREMRDYLRGLGLKVPVTGVVSSEYVPDVASAGAEMDFTSENYYADHPAFGSKDWSGPFYYNDSNPLRSSSIYQVAPWLAGLRWQNKPVAVREWATVWPNSYRGIAIPEMAAYASLQDFDAVLLFGYQLARTPEMLSDFDHQADPPVWGLYALGALSFLRGDIQPSTTAATVAWPADALFRWPNGLTGLHRLAWFVRLNSTSDPAAVQELRGLQVARRAARVRGTAARARLASRSMGPSRPGGTSATGISLLVGPGDSLPDTLDLFASAGVPVSRKMLETGALRSSTGEVVRETVAGILRVSSPRSAAVCGQLPVNRPIQVGPLTLITQTPVGALMAVSLDDRPLATSSSYVVKMVSRAANTGQSLEVAPPGSPARLRLKDWGHAPVTTFGRLSARPAVLRKGKRTLLSLGLVDGTWELLVRGGQATLVCDTAGVHGWLFGRRFMAAAGVPVVVDLPHGRTTASAQ